MNDFIQHGNGWKELHYISPDPTMLGFKKTGMNGTLMNGNDRNQALGRKCYSLATAPIPKQQSLFFKPQREWVLERCLIRIVGLQIKVLVQQRHWKLSGCSKTWSL
jgi:hypothetical protein